MSNLSQFFSGASSTGSPKSDTITSVMQIFSNSTAFTIPSAATYVGYGVLGAGAAGRSNHCIPTSPAAFPADYVCCLGCPSSPTAISPAPTGCLIRCMSGGGGGGFAWKENSLASPTDITACIIVGAACIFPTDATSRQPIDIGGTSCICGAGLTTICATGGTGFVNKGEGGVGSGGDINNHGANITGICTSTIPTAGFGGKFCSSPGGGAGGIWGPGRPNHSGFSQTGGREGEPGVVGKGAVFTSFIEQLVSCVAPQQPRHSGLFFMQKPEIGFVTQHTFDCRLSQAKTIFAAAGGGGIKNNSVMELDHLPFVCAAFSSTVMAGATGGGSAAGMSGFGAGGGGASFYSRLPTAFSATNMGAAGCGGGGSASQFCCSPTVQFASPFGLTMGFGGNGVGVVEYWTTS